MGKEENTNWSWSVGCVIIRDGKVLLGRHTYGAGKGKLIIPGGYVQHGELPKEAAKREVMEETGNEVSVGDMLGIRCSVKDWYMIFAGKYVSGRARSDHDENSEVLWLNIEEVLRHSDVPDMTKEAIRSATDRKKQAFIDKIYKTTGEIKPYQYFTSKGSDYEN